MVDMQADITLNELMRLNLDARVEIMDGEVFQMQGSGMMHHIFLANLYRVLDEYVQKNPIGSVFPDGLIYLMNTPGLKDAFIPDISFIRNEDIPADFDLDKPYPGAPQLAVEVISPDENPDQVWVVYPKAREMHQYRADTPETVRVYRGSQPLDVDALFPRLTLTTDQIFKLPPWAIRDE